LIIVTAIVILIAAAAVAGDVHISAAEDYSEIQYMYATILYSLLQ